MSDTTPERIKRLEERFKAAYDPDRQAFVRGIVCVIVSDELMNLEVEDTLVSFFEKTYKEERRFLAENGTVVAFHGYRIVAKPMLDDGGVSEYGCNFTVYADDEVAFCEGFVKWDGCSNWNFGEQMIHFCGADEARGLGELFHRIYELAAEIIPAFDRSLAAMDEGESSGS